MLAWLNFTSNPDIWLTVAQVPIRGKRRKGKQTGALFTVEVAGLENILSSCVRQVKERYRAERESEQLEQTLDVRAKVRLISNFF